mgnify:FL=1
MTNVPIQQKLGYLYSGGCYLLCLAHYFGQDEDILKLYDYFLKKGYIDEDCFVKDPVSIVKYLSGNNYTVEKTTTKPTLQPNDFIVEYWYNPRTKLHHFTLPDWDSLGFSTTRKEGVIESYRYFKRKI